jgi:hypothetical protein
VSSSVRLPRALLPHIKITDLLLEVDRWTGFSRHFTHLKTEQPCEDRTLLLTGILADAINLGISKMRKRVREQPLASSIGLLPYTSVMKPMQRRWPSSSTIITGTIR